MASSPVRAPKEDAAAVVTDDDSQGEAEKVAPSPTAPRTVPNGGLKAWVQVAGGFFLFFNTWGLVSIYGVYQTYYQINADWPQSASQISWIGSLQACLLFVGGFVIGPFFDMGYLRLVLGLGTFLVPFGLMMTSICNAYWQAALAQGLCVGLGFGCLFLPSIAIVPQYFTTKRAAAFGVASTGTVAGGVLYEVIFKQLQPRIGFGWATRVIAFIALATMMVPLLGMKQVTPPAKSRKAFLDFSVWKYLPYTVYCLAIFLNFMAIYVTYFYIQLFALEKTDTDPELASYLLAIVIAASLPGRVLPSILADKIGPINVQFPLALLSSLLCFCWIAISSQAGTITFCVLYGVCTGALQSLPGPTVMTLSPNLRMIGAHVGMSMTIAGIGALVGNPISGAIVGGRGGWIGLQVFLGCVFALGAASLLVSRLLKTGFVFMARA